MPKKLLLPVLISLMFALPASAQEEGWQPEPGPSIPEMAMKVFRFVGGVVSSGNLVETDELALEQMQEKPEQAEQPEPSAGVPEGETVAQPASEEKPAVEPVQSEPIPSVASESAPVEKQPVQSIAEPQPEKQADVPVVQKNPSVAAPAEEQPVKEPKAKVKPAEKADKVDKKQPVTEKTSTAKAFPEITVSTYQDTLPAELSPAELQEKALAGNPEAQYRLGMGSYNGGQFVQDNDKAFLWWQESAKQGYPKAQHIMGVAYRRGIGTLKNAEKALEWFTKAAQQGRAIDQYIVADVYYEGKVNNIKDDALAVYWATHAAAQGHPGALVLLAQAKLEGRGILPNIIHAYVLAKKAEEFDRNADVVVEDIENAMTEEQLKIAETLTLEDALKPVSQTSLMVQKELEARAGKPIQEQSEKQTKTEESNDND